MFEPKSVAVVGASKKPGKIGYEILNNIINYGYKGEIYPININEENILGKKAYRSVSDVPGDIDFAVISLPSKNVLESLEECGRKGVKSAAVITSGFGEVGDYETERKLVETAKRYNMPFIGPNIFGFIYAPSNLNASFGPTEVKAGKIAFITQSGALGIALMGWTITNKIGLSSIISIGNKAQVTEKELINDYLKDDPNSKAILMYIEGLHDGRAAMRTFAEVGLKKPVIALKAGRSARGAVAAASHTGSLAGSDKIYSAAFEQVGVLRALDASEAFSWARCITNNPKPKGPNVVIMTNGGGVGVMATDACEDYKVELYNDQNKLRELFFKPDIMPSYGSTKNPIDITGGGGREAYKKALEIAYNDENIHSIIGLFCETATTDLHALGDTIYEVVKANRDKKPFVFGGIGGEKMDAMLDRLNESEIAAYNMPEKAVSSLSALYRWSNFVDQYEKTGRTKPLELPLEKINSLIADVRKDGRTQMLEHEAKEIFRLCGLDVPSFVLARSADEAVKEAKKIGFPVVMKIVSEHIIHKSDAGAVVVNIKTDEEAKDAYEKIMKNSKAYSPEANLRGVLVSSMAPKAIEVIVGVSRDATFGPVIMFGLGGVYVEVLKDVVFRVAPVTKQEAQRMIDSIKTKDLLYGARGAKPCDMEALRNTVYVVSQLVSQVHEIKELDINPLFTDETGTKVVDARVTLTKEEK